MQNKGTPTAMPVVSAVVRWLLSPLPAAFFAILGTDVGDWLGSMLAGHAQQAGVGTELGLGLGIATGAAEDD